MSNISDWTEITNKVFNQKPVKVDAVFVHGWGDLTDEMIDYAAKIFKKSKASAIVLNGAKEYELGKTGLNYWKKKLKTKYKVPPKKIFNIGEAINTYDEAVGFIGFAGKNKLKSAAIVSVPQHILRAFLTDLGVMKTKKVNLKLYPRTLPKVDWSQEISIHSLSGKKEQTTRFGRLAGEFARISDYRKRTEAGERDFSIVSIKEGLRYLNKD